MKMTVIIPTYNEGENLRLLTESILQLGLDFRILIVDDNSPDGTGRIADDMAAAIPAIGVLHRPGREGYGRALTAGFRHVLAHEPEVEALLSMDADFSHQPRYLPVFAQALIDHDVVIGSRYVRGGGVANWGLHRRLLSRGGNLYTRCITGLAIRDCTSGFAAYRRRVLESLKFEDLGAQGYSFLIELKFLIAQSGASVKEIPITFIERQRGTSKMHLGIAAEALLLAWKLRAKRR